MSRSFVLAAFGVLSALLTAPADAARIKVTPLRSGVSLVSVVGELAQGDGERFRQAVSEITSALVALNAPGGDEQAGIEIGRLVRSRGLGTLVGAKATCGGACALAWMGGARRYLEPGASVSLGSGSTDTAVASYIGGLSLPTEAVAYLTVADGGERRIDAKDAGRLGIPVEDGVKPDPGRGAGVSRALVRAAKDFDATYKENGISGVMDDIKACYLALGKGAPLSRVAYCHALDRIAMGVDGAASERGGFERQDYLVPEAVDGRTRSSLADAGVAETEREALAATWDLGTDAAFAAAMPDQED